MRRLLEAVDCTWITNVRLRCDVVDRGRRGEFRRFDVTPGRPIRDHSRRDTALVWGRGSSIPHAGSTDDIVGVLFGQHTVIDGWPRGRVVRILFARGLIGVVSPSARIIVVRGEGGRIGVRRDLAQSGLRGFGLIRPVRLVEMLLYVVKEVV